MYLRISAAVLGVLWTAGVLWWDAPLDLQKIVTWSIAGALTALAWYCMIHLMNLERSKPRRESRRRAVSGNVVN